MSPPDVTIHTGRMTVHTQLNVTLWWLTQVRRSRIASPCQNIGGCIPLPLTPLAVAAHRCHELWSHTHVAEWQTMTPDMWPPNSPDLNPVDYAIWSVIQLNAAGNILGAHYKDMNCDVSFSLRSVSTLFRWGEHFCNIRVKCFLLFITVQKLYKSIKIFQSYDHKCTATFLWFTV